MGDKDGAHIFAYDRDLVDYQDTNVKTSMTPSTVLLHSILDDFFSVEKMTMRHKYSILKN